MWGWAEAGVAMGRSGTAPILFHAHIHNIFVHNACSWPTFWARAWRQPAACCP